MNNVTVIEMKNEKTKGFILKIDNIEHIKNYIELSLVQIIEKINVCINECNFEEAEEHLFIAKRLYNDNSKINSLGFILKEEYLKKKIEDTRDFYEILNLRKELNKLINSISYMENIEESEQYKNAYEEALSIRNKINQEEILNNLNKQFENIKKYNNEKVLLLIKEIFKTEYENDFYNSIEFIFNTIENDIYMNFKDFNSLQDNLKRIYLLYKFNLENDISRKINILYELNISEFINIEYVYKPYAIKHLQENKYKTLDDLKKDLLTINNDIKTFDKKSMPI